jgi:CPA1 family monovalent cation:H+ antiporter
MNLFNIFSILVIIAAFLQFINFKFLKVQDNIGIVIISLLSTFLIMATQPIFPDFFNETNLILSQIRFSEVLFDFFLSVILFAGSTHMKFKDLWDNKYTVLANSTFGVIISTIIIGILTNFIFKIINLDIPILYGFLFGALISPTDPVSALDILKNQNTSKSLLIKIQGESLFNDGVGYVIFSVILTAINSGNNNLNFLQGSLLFVKEAFGAVILGLIVGYIGIKAIKNELPKKFYLLVTIAMVFGGTYIAQLIEVSAPITMVVAGIYFGNRERKNESLKSIDTFWEMLDELFDTILFMLLGLEFLRIEKDFKIMIISIFIIFIVLFARFISIIPPVIISKENFKHTYLLTWSGLRGTISFAMALITPENDFKNIFVTITYIVVVFSILVQGLTIGKVSKSFRM